MKVFVDENLSPRVARWLCERGIVAEHAAHVGMAGCSDPVIWDYAYRRDMVVATNNIGDFISLADRTEAHPGIIAVRPHGLRAEEQFALVAAAMAHATRELGGDMLNRVVEIWSCEDCRIQVMPAM